MARILVVSAKPLTSEQVKKTEKIFSAKHKNDAEKVEFVYNIDKDLLGGILDRKSVV